MSRRLVAAAMLVLVAAAGLVGDAVVENPAGRAAADGPGAYRSAVGWQLSAPSRPYVICAADSRC
jgi:hypothetical protein